MLILSRKKNETIVIGDDVKVTVIEVRGDKVRLGVSAPVTTSVHRSEVYEMIQREKMQEETGDTQRGIDQRTDS